MARERALEYYKVEIDAATTPIHRVDEPPPEKKGAEGPVHQRREHRAPRCATSSGWEPEQNAPAHMG